MHVSSKVFQGFFQKSIFIAITTLPVAALAEPKSNAKVEVRTTSDDSAEVSQVIENKGESKTGKVYGPGGKLLRSDYPGLNLAMKPVAIESDAINTALADKDRGERKYLQQLQQIQSEIDTLRNGVLDAKARIALLNDTLLRKDSAESRTHIVFENKLGTFYKLNRLMVSLDGNEIFNQLASKDGAIQRDSIEVFNNAPKGGTHQLSISTTIGGDTVFFTYFNKYSIDVNNSCTFDTKPGTYTYVTITTENNGDPTAQADQKPTLACKVLYRSTPLSDKTDVKNHNYSDLTSGKEAKNQ